MKVNSFVVGVVVGMGLLAALAATVVPSALGADRTAHKLKLAPTNAREKLYEVQMGVPPAGMDLATRGGWRADGARRELSDDEMNRVIATARDVNPEWADELEKLRQSDPAALREKVSREARKLLGLTMLKEREPDLYKVRVQDMRVQNEIRGLSETWNNALKSGDIALQESTMKEIEAGARRQVELDIQARGFELVALDRSLKDARKRLQDDIRDREKAIGEILNSIRSGEEIKFGRRQMSQRPRGDDNDAAQKSNASTNAKQGRNDGAKPPRDDSAKSDQKPVSPARGVE